MAKRILYFKVLRQRNNAAVYGRGSWNPPGVWNHDYKSVRFCVRGWHFFRDAGQVRSFRFEASFKKKSFYRLWKIEVRGRVMHQGNKSVASGARLVRPFTGKIFWNYNYYDDFKEYAIFKNGYFVEMLKIKKPKNNP